MVKGVRHDRDLCASEMPAANFSKDFACYMDFCLARLMVWRALRRERRAGGGR
jgi:hypothetical protein